MQASTVKIQEVFLSNLVLKIPYFQRSYVWKEENWERFLQDMLDLPDTQENYFLGSVILKKSGTNDLGYEQFDIVDGQQRLTTTVLFMKLLYMMAGKNDRFKNSFMQEDIDDPVLRPNRQDAAAFNSIVKLDGVGSPITGDGQVRKAFDFFKQKLNIPEVRDKANTIIRFMNNNVFFVRIIVDEQENEQQIFDTINSLGQSLTTGELLKNFLFDDNSIDLYDEKWAPIFERTNNAAYNYWNEQLTKGRLKANNIETFFYYFMLIKMQDKNLRSALSPGEKKQYRKQEGLFESYKCLIRKHNLDKDSLINEIVEYAQMYQSSFNQSILKEALVKYPGIKRLSFIMFAQGAWTPVPYILYLLKNVTDQTELKAILEYMETYIVRRIICKSKNSNYSDLFSENLIGQGVATFVDFKAYVNDANNRGSLLMPSDDEVKEAVKTFDCKGKNATLMLYLLESKINTNFLHSSYENGYDYLDAEPMMPLKQDLSNWPLNDGYSEEQREELVKTLGNHILIRGSKLAAKKSNEKWQNKKVILTPLVSELQMSQIVSATDWREANIEARNKALGDKIVELWKL